MGFCQALVFSTYPTSEPLKLALELVLNVNMSIRSFDDELPYFCTGEMFFKCNLHNI